MTLAPEETTSLAPVASDEPALLDALTDCRRTAWGTLAWSDPDEPPIELFGPPSDDVAGPVAAPAPDSDVWTMPVPRQKGGR